MDKDQTSALVNSVFYCLMIILSSLLLQSVVQNGNDEQLALVIIYFVVQLLFWPIQMSYHLFEHKGDHKPMLQRIDRGSMLFLIASIFSPILLNYVNRPISIAIVIVSWVLVAIGFTLLLVVKNLSRHLAPVLAFVVGLIGIFTLISYLGNLSGGEMGLFFIGVIFFLSSGVIYVLKKPDPKPETFGFHEMFHTMLSIGAVLLHFLVVSSLTP